MRWRACELGRARRPASGRGAHRSGRRRGAESLRARRRPRASASSARMQAAERAEVVVVQRLHAERDAVDAGGAIAAEALRLDAGRIGFERDLGVRRDRPVLRRSRRGSRRPSRGSISDGVPPPKKMLDDGAARRARGRGARSRARRRDVARLSIGAWRTWELKSQ